MEYYVVEVELLIILINEYLKQVFTAHTLIYCIHTYINTFIFSCTLKLIVLPHGWAKKS